MAEIFKAGEVGSSSAASDQSNNASLEALRGLSDFSPMRASTEPVGSQGGDRRAEVNSMLNGFAVVDGNAEKSGGDKDETIQDVKTGIEPVVNSQGQVVEFVHRDRDGQVTSRLKWDDFKDMSPKPPNNDRRFPDGWRVQVTTGEEGNAIWVTGPPPARTSFKLGPAGKLLPPES